METSSSYTATLTVLKPKGVEHFWLHDDGDYVKLVAISRRGTEHAEEAIRAFARELTEKAG